MLFESELGGHAMKIRYALAGALLASAASSPAALTPPI